MPGLASAQAVLLNADRLFVLGLQARQGCVNFGPRERAHDALT